MSPIDTRMEEALRHHQAGELARAGEIYTAILEAEPDFVKEAGNTPSDRGQGRRQA